MRYYINIDVYGNNAVVKNVIITRRKAMKKRIVMAALAATMLIGMNASQAFASDDNIPYSFKLTII